MAVAEFLIYDKIHWMDGLTPSQLTEYELKHSNFQEKYGCRFQKGDIIEVQSDGFFTGQKARGFNKDAFRLLVVPELEADKQYIQPVSEIEIISPIAYDLDGTVLTRDVIVKRRKFAVNVPGAAKVVTMNEQEFTLAKMDKT